MTNKLLILFLVIIAAYQASIAQVTADFSASVTRSCVSTQVIFTDLSSSSSGEIVEWAWDLNGVSANKKNPSTIFTNPGGYDICLIAIDAAGNRDTLCREDYVIIWEKPIANFTNDPFSGCSPLEVSFTNASTSANGAIAEAIWDVGGSTNLVILDEVDSILTSTYVASGMYSASLFIKDDKGCTASVAKGDLITVFPRPTIDYTFEVISGCELPWEVQFTNLSPDASTTYNWYFGNGNTFEGANPPLITYDTIGNFDLTIAIERNGCIDTIRDVGVISPGSAPDFSVNPPGACINTPLTFSETSQISSDSIFWDFGDGNISTESSPVHTYAIADCFEVTMIRYSGTCIDTVTKPCVQINPSPIISAVVDNQFACTLPIEIGFEGIGNEPGSFTWTFKGLGDDKVLFEDTASLLINQNGSYAVDLNYISDDGCTASIENLPIIIETFAAGLPVSNNLGCSPLAISLKDNISSNLAVINWEWTVIDDNNPGNNISFNIENPAFTLVDTGRYDVQLIVESETGCIDTIIAEEYIKVGIPPEVDFSATPLEDCVLTPKNFTSITSDFADAWVWGTDGTDTLNIEENPSIFLTTAISWDISLTAYHNGCSNTIIKENYINILEPAVKYVIEYDCDDPYTVTLDDRTTGADSSYWEIELAPDNRDTFFNTNLEQYTFPDRGRYFINHYAINYASGCEHFRIDTIIITDPQAVMTLDTLKGCAPLTININGASQDALQIEYIIPGATIDSSLSVLDPILTYTESGPFLGPQLIITDYHGCQDTVTIMDSVLVNAPTAIAGYPVGVCVPDSAQLIDLSTDRLGEIIERRWYFDNATVYSEEESLFVQITENKFYNLRLAVTDNWGCEDSIYIAESVFGSDLDSSFFTIDTITCTDNPIRFQLNNTQQDVVDYLWDFGDGNTSIQANPIHSYASEGLYTVCLTINDIYNCPKFLCKENYVAVLNPLAMFSGDPLYETCPPLITNFTNSSTNSTSYVWNYGDNSGISDIENPSHIYNNPGTFDVTLIASSSPSCSDTLTLVDYVTIDGPSGSFEFLSDSSCLPLTITLSAVADDVYTFGWDFGNGESSISDTPTMTDTLEYVYEETGSFVPQLILSDGNGCIRTFNADTVHVNSLTLDFNTNTEITCITPAFVSLENMSQSSDPNIEYNWEITGPQNFNFDSEDASFNISQVGGYNVLLSANGINCIDTIRLDSMIQIGSDPIVDFEFTSDQACEEVLAIFQNNSTNEYGEITQYEWSFGDGSTSTAEQGEHIFTAANNNTVSLTVTTEFGCTSTTQQTIEILPHAVPFLPEDYTMCVGDSVQILGTTVGTGIQDISFEWNLPLNLSCNDCLQPTANPFDTTTYILTAVHSNGCITMDTMIINVVPIMGPQISLSLDTVICDMDTAIISITNFDSNLNYTWDASPTLSCFDCEFATAYPEDDTYYTVTVRNEYGCFKTDSLFVEVERSIEDFLIEDRGICEDNTTIITVNSEILNPIWQSDNTLTCTECYEVTATPTESQFYYVDVVSSAGCDYRDSVFVTVVPEDALTTNDDGRICDKEQYLLASSGVGNLIWTPDFNITSNSEALTFAYPNESTTYTVTYTYDECIQSDEVHIEVIYKADITAIGDTICQDESALLTAQGIANKFTWLDLSGNVLSTGDSIIYDTDKTEDLIVIGKLGLCEEDTAKVHIKVEPNIDVFINTYDYKLFINSAEIVDIDFDEDANYTYAWSPANGLSCDDCPDPKIKNIQQAMQYTLTVTDENTGCNIEETISVRFISLCSDKAFYIPNIFSPNSDGVNDYFQVLAERPEEFDAIRLYDRWGNQMYVSTDVLGQWDGTYRGQSLNPGVYPYRIDYTCTETGEQLSFYGDVTVIK